MRIDTCQRKVSRNQYNLCTTVQVLDFDLIVGSTRELLQSGAFLLCLAKCMYYHFLPRCSRNCRIVYSPKVMLYCALKPCLVTEKSVVNLILRNVVLSPLTVTVIPDLEPLSLSILWPKMSVNSTKSQL